MAFNIINTSKELTLKYKRYLKTMFDIKDPDYKKIFEKKLDQDAILSKGPYLDVVNSFVKGRSVKELIDEDVISQDFKYIKSIYSKTLHYHQEESLLKALQNKNLVVSTGTGSGKTESFLIPIINELMREKENGTLCDGVRALIIYPMNALANDQVDRLRECFQDYSDITFGCYTGQTLEYTETRVLNGKVYKGAIEVYKDLNAKKENVKLRNPLPNERISREQIKKRPPHILITNYAMLEYLMLRPEDNVFFDGQMAKYWKYIVLDEAHTYTGSTGIEVSMLLRRLNAQLNSPKIQYFLTSATLGSEDTNKEVVDFAKRLCNAEFHEEDVIRARRVSFKKEDKEFTSINISFYHDIVAQFDAGYDDEYINNYIKNNYEYSISKTLDETLFNIISNDLNYWKIKKFLNKPKEVIDILSVMEWKSNELSDFVLVASKASKDGLKLFDARYHMFIKATEGVFITLAPHKDLFLTRKNRVIHNDNEYKVFEAVTCTQCHSLYLLGYIENDFLVQKNTQDASMSKEAFLVGDLVNDDDEDSELKEENLEVKKYEICPHCGFIREANQVHKTCCGHNDNEFVKLVKVKTTNDIDGRVTKCIACEGINRLGILRGFFTGQEASTSVLATSLFEQLPSHEKKIIINQDDDDSGFGSSENRIEEINKAKQFIAFSDSRQAAAYFASYLSISYDGILYGRVIIDELKKMDVNNLSLPKFVTKLAHSFSSNGIIPFTDYITLKETSSSLDSYDYEKLAYQAILKEFVDCNSKTSLIGLGLLGLDFSPDIIFGPNTKLNLTATEVKDICLQFAIGMMSEVAMSYPISLQKADKEYFTHNGVEKDFMPNSRGKYTNSFLPIAKSNKRFDYLKRIINKEKPDISDDDIKNKYLSGIWNRLFAPNKGTTQIMELNSTSKTYKLNLSNILIAKEKKWYCCDKCHKITQINVKGVCPTFKCEGTLHEINIEDEFRNNHYYRMYNDLKIEPLRVVEHTAQLNRERGYKYQNYFKDQLIDVLSCSTTFEMGVDVGNLETVFMRNMPPSPSNYAQRAGRAGRSTKSAAFALTFCNKSNHDFNYFDNPVNMISGNIQPPLFKVENEKICIRHIYSAALSFFFKKYPSYFNTTKTMMEKNDDTNLKGYDVLKDYLESHPDDLKDFLINSVPTDLIDKFEINTFGWLKYLFDEEGAIYPSLKRVLELYTTEINTLLDLYNTAKANGDSVLKVYGGRLFTQRSEWITSFLSRNNILPKYGFPVDTVELFPNDKNQDNNSTGLELSRDLSVAISEYAPGCQIVANNRLITSQFIRKIQGKEWRCFDYIECSNPECKTLNIKISTGDGSFSETTCKQCGKPLDLKLKKTYLIPEFGFIASPDVAKPSLIKPEKTYKTEASFADYNSAISENKFNFGSVKVTVSLIDNGPMNIMTSNEFFVCPTCGYAEEADNQFFKTKKPIKHKDPKGYPCKNTSDFHKYSLGYQFLTDVCKISIDSPLLSKNPYDEAYSILQAIIIAASQELNIDQNEIAGCLQYVNNGYANYNYILYDKTPGGAGHIKRLNGENILYRVLLSAYNKANRCTCGDESGDSSCYNCLRTYANQKHHDIIKRKYVIEYLGGILVGYENRKLESELEKDFLNKILSKADTYTMNSNDEYTLSFGNNKWSLELQVYLDKLQNVIQPSKPDFVFTPLNKDNHKPICVFTDGFTFHNDIVDKDSLKRDAIIYSGKYRVWSLSWDDVHESDKDYSTNILIDNDGLDISKNQFNLLLDYLKANNSEDMFKLAANEYIKTYLLKNDASIMYEIDSIKDNIVELNNYSCCNKIGSGLFNVYTFSDSNSCHIVSYLNDELSVRISQYFNNWNGWLAFNNIMQFTDKFTIISEIGLQNEIYDILDNVVKQEENDDSKWNDIISLVMGNAVEFAKQCKENNFDIPSEVGFEVNGYTCELLWKKENIVFLNEEQIAYKNEFESQGYIVVGSFEEYVNLGKER